MQSLKKAILAKDRVQTKKDALGVTKVVRVLSGFSRCAVILLTRQHGDPTMSRAPVSRHARISWMRPGLGMWCVQLPPVGHPALRLVLHACTGLVRMPAKCCLQQLPGHARSPVTCILGSYQRLVACIAPTYAGPLQEQAEAGEEPRDWLAFCEAMSRHRGHPELQYRACRCVIICSLLRGDFSCPPYSRDLLLAGPAGSHHRPATAHGSSIKRAESQCLRAS